MEPLTYRDLYAYRGLFYVKLLPKPSPSSSSDGLGGPHAPRPFMVSTAHYPWKGNAREVESGENVRIGAAKATARAVQAWQSLDPAMPVFFTGTPLAGTGSRVSCTRCACLETNGSTWLTPPSLRVRVLMALTSPWCCVCLCLVQAT